MSEFWHLLGRRKTADLTKLLGISSAELQDWLALIRMLDTEPGSQLVEPVAHWVKPDILVTKAGDEYVVTLVDRDLPRLRLNPAYLRLADNKADAETRDYVRERARSAEWLLNAVAHRQRTIVKAAESIVSFQRDFFEHGVSCLKPLVLQEVAHDIGVSESTVSRTVNGKYMQTPLGVFELKYFFHSALTNVSGAEVSSVTVKERIRALVRREEPAHPLSDDAITQRLRGEGVVLSRRVVAKYRSELRIPPSATRRRAWPVLGE